jgi:hypothetical protein
MTSMLTDRVAAFGTRLHDTLDQLADLAAELDLADEAEVLDLWRRLETARRRLDAAEHAVIARVERAGLPGRHGHPSTAGFARQLLGLHPGEASARVAAARSFGPRQSQTGQPLAPIYPQVAAALGRGELSTRHGQVIARTIDTLPPQAQGAHADTVEQLLVEHAQHLDPKLLARAGQHVLDHLDPDGRLDQNQQTERSRGLHGSRGPDGAGHYRIHATAELGELLDVLFDCLAKPTPASDGTPDPRSAAQRRHDALTDGLRRLLGTGTLPDAGGMAATLILTMTATDYATHTTSTTGSLTTGTGSPDTCTAGATGMATTGHGYAIPVALAKSWLGPETRAILVLLSTTKAITAYSSTQRIFTEQQRLAMLARDHGCSHPHCDTPAQRCQAHHIIEYQNGGPTSTDNGTLICAAHHRSFEKMGWTNLMINGIPHWAPPAWLNPAQTPRRNTMHDIPQPDLPGP